MGAICFQNSSNFFLIFNFLKTDSSNTPMYIYILFSYLADAFIQNDLHCIQAKHVLLVHVFSGNWTYNLLRC